MSTYKFYHLSDLHIGNEIKFLDLDSSLIQNYPSLIREIFSFATTPYNKNILNTAFQSKIIRDTDFDFILFTGDISNSGSNRDMSISKSLIDKFLDGVKNYRKRKNTTGSYSFFIMPGNHDRFKVPFLLPAGNTFDNEFSNFWKVGQGVQSRVIIKEGLDPLGLVFADFTLENQRDQNIEFGYFGQGKVYQNKLNKLIADTVKLKNNNPKTKILWITHFPPCFPSDSTFNSFTEKRLTLIDEDTLVDSAGENEVDLLFSGHRHDFKMYTIKNLNVYSSGTTSAYKSKSKSFQYYEIDTKKVNVISKLINFELPFGADEFSETRII